MRMRGTVKKVIPTRGFGFVIGEDGQEYFVLYSELPEGDWERLKTLMAVEFTPDSNGSKGNGLQALEVRIAA